jgi:hypothetical protein
MPNETIRAMLAPGTPLAKARVQEVVDLVHAEPRRMAQLVECLWEDDAAIANRAADALERITHSQPKLLQRWKEPLLSLLSEAKENKLRWNLAFTIPRLKLTPTECVHAAAELERWLDDTSSIVRTAALQGMADLAIQHAPLLPAVTDHLRWAERSGSAAMRARSRILLKKLERANKK